MTCFVQYIQYVYTKYKIFCLFGCVINSASSACRNQDK
jgi:hypothetical protein